MGNCFLLIGLTWIQGMQRCAEINFLQECLLANTGQFMYSLLVLRFGINLKK